MAICENNCNVKEYSKETNKVTCECEMKYNLSLLKEEDLLKYNFQNKTLSTNLISLKCYYTLFTKEGMVNNIGSYIMIFFITFFAISAILFYKCGYPLLEEDIREIIELKTDNNEDIPKMETINIEPKEKRMSKSINLGKTKRKKNKKKIIIKKVKVNKLKLNYNNSFSKIELKPDFSKTAQKNNLDYIDYEINSFSYEQSLKYDKRTYFLYYISLIKTKHPIIFSSCPLKDYNSIIIKVDLFIFSFSLYYFFNALFFNESTIHKIYEDHGIYNFIYLIPFILYSFIMAHALSIIIKYFSLSERNICKLKYTNINERDIGADNVKKCLVIKYLCFFVFGFLALLFLWYYLSSFGAVYQNTQIYLIKNTLISLGFALVYPFVLNLLPSFLRIYSLKNPNRETIYKISKFIQYI